MKLFKNGKHKIISLASFTTLAVAFFMLIMFFYWMLYPYKPLVVNNTPLPILDKELHRHDNIIYELDYCKQMDLPVSVRRKLVDGLVFAVADVTTGINDVGCRVQNFAIEVPHSLPTGEYIMTIEYVYKVNPIREVIVRTHTEKFTIVE